MSKEKGDLKTKESVYKSLQVVFRSVDVVSVLLMSLFSGVSRCFGVLLASWVLWCPLCSVVLSPFSVSFLFNKVSLFESVVLGPIPHQNMTRTIFTPVTMDPSAASDVRYSWAWLWFNSFSCMCLLFLWLDRIYPPWVLTKQSVSCAPWQVGFPSNWPTAALWSLFFLL